jgi:membrane-associated phospholipid phosphatase
MVVAVTSLSIISFYLNKHTEKILPLIVSMVGSSITVFILKELVNRSRPVAEAIYKETLGSFPSGHAAAAVALYGFFIAFAWKEKDSPHLRSPFIIFMIVFILLVGISRIYLGVHYFTDVLVGYIVGLVWLCIALAFMRIRSKK